MGAVHLGGRREALESRLGMAARGSESRWRPPVGDGPREGGATAAGVLQERSHYGTLVHQALMNPIRGAALLVHGGGPTQVINASLAGVADECRRHPAIT